MSGTHSLDVTPQGIVGCIDDLRLSMSIPSLDLVHRILVAGGAIYHICGRIFTNKWDGEKEGGVGEGGILISRAKTSGLSDGVEDAILERTTYTAELPSLSLADYRARSVAQGVACCIKGRVDGRYCV